MDAVYRSGAKYQRSETYLHKLLISEKTQQRGNMGQLSVTE